MIYRRISKEPISKQPEDITPVLVDAILMPNGEVMCAGKTIGRFRNIQKFIYKK